MRERWGHHWICYHWTRRDGRDPQSEREEAGRLSLTPFSNGNGGKARGKVEERVEMKMSGEKASEWLPRAEIMIKIIVNY